MYSEHFERVPSYRLPALGNYSVGFSPQNKPAFQARGSDAKPGPPDQPNAILAASGIQRKVEATQHFMDQSGVAQPVPDTPETRKLWLSDFRDQERDILCTLLDANIVEMTLNGKERAFRLTVIGQLQR